MNGRRGKEKLVVEVAAAHNLMPKDGEGSSSAFVEVKFENQTGRTQVKHRDLNPVWNEKLVFSVNDVAGLPYRTVEVNVFNERKSNSTRNFLGRVWVSGSTVAREGEAAAQIFTLEKRTVFSHVRGEISLKLYISTTEKEEEEKVKQVISAGAGGAVASSTPTPKSKKNKKVQGKNTVLPVHQENKPNPAKQVEPSQPIVVTSVPGAAVCGGEMAGPYSAAGRNTTSPQLGGGTTLKLDKTSATYDLVEQMQYLYIKVVKARFDFAGGELVAEAKLGNYRGITKKAPANLPVWDQVFAFSKDSIQSSFVEVYVREINRDDFLGRVWFDLNEIPRRVPPDSQLAPQWYRMEGKTGDDKSKAGEVMVAAWFGTQADEAFAEAWHSKSANVGSDGLSSIKSKVYLSPKLWYLRVGVLEAQDIVVPSCDKGSSLLRYPDLFVKVQVGNQVLRTRVSKTFSWNEDLMFVVGEPFEDLVILSVEDRVSPHKDEVVGRLVLPVSGLERRANEKPVTPMWFNLDTNFNNNNQSCLSKSVRFAPRIRLRASLDGGYHVLDESTVYSSDLRPTAKQLWKPRVGVLEVGFLGAANLVPMKMKQGTRGSTDSYCVAKYGQKWIRTRTVVDSLAPKWNEQYTWEVFDPCTVITIAVFDNSRVLTSSSTGTVPDLRIGKVRIRLSTLETDRVYPLTYPLLMLHPSGVKKMGELSLAVRFSCGNNMVNMLHMYTLPLLPKMHYVQPLTVSQLDGLRYQAMNVVTGRLSRAEPPLGREVVEYMLDHDSQMWSMRKSKANFLRLTSVLTWAVNMCRWFESVRNWNKPVYSAGFLIAFFVVVLIPELVVPCVFLFMAAVGLLRYRWRPRAPPRMDTRLSCAENVEPDELDEEFDFFPSARGPEVVRLRYDRLRSAAGRIQTVVGDVAMQAERFQALLSWRDPRATFLFVVFCFLAALGFYMVPFRLVVAAWGVYVLRPPKFRNRLPSCAVSFFKRLPTRADSLLL
ncbi:unnamed protein product [Cuscuta campestris]|uniref:C2 domain-containing protein n=1 Tax=Cuscuta campestris TaxID=132261 RepID=A0A484NJM0_9ASTE|nr:unnamed protein product [Cuscuta campestris]